MLDPHQPRGDRLPNAKMPLAKTIAEQKDVKRSREHIANLHKSGYSTSVTSTVAGVKRRAALGFEHAGVKRGADKLDSGRAKKAKPTTSFMDYLLKGQDAGKTAAAGSSTAASSSSKQNVEGQNGRADVQKTSEAKRRKLEAESRATNVDNKANVATTDEDTTLAATTKAADKAGDQKTSGAKECELNSKSCANNVDNKANVAATDKGTTVASTDNDTTVAATDKDTTVTATSKAEAQLDSSPNSDMKPEVGDSVTHSEAVSTPESSPKEGPKSSTTSSDGADSQTMTTGNTSVGSILAKGSIPVGVSEAQTPGKPEAAESDTSVAGKKRKAGEASSTPDKDSTSVDASEVQTDGKPETADNDILAAAKKRKADDEGSNPPKKPKLESSNPKNVLRNYDSACYMNATLHLLHTIPDFAELRNTSSEEVEADRILSQSEMYSVLGRGREAMKNRIKLCEHLAEKAERNEL
jgi:hypothetical protein